MVRVTLINQDYARLNIFHIDEVILAGIPRIKEHVVYEGVAFVITDVVYHWSNKSLYPSTCIHLKLVPINEKEDETPHDTSNQ